MSCVNQYYVHGGWGGAGVWVGGWGLEHMCGAGLGWEFKAALTPTAGRHAALAQLFRWGGHPLGMDLLHALPVNYRNVVHQSSVTFLLLILKTHKVISHVCLAKD